MFNHVSRDDGLSQSFVYDIAQDHQGFLWFGTQEGLNRYDGYEFRVYREEPDDPASLPDSTIRALLVDHTGVLWVGTENGGLAKFHRETQRFTRYPAEAGVTGALPSNRIRSLYEDSRGALWVGTDGHGLAIRASDNQAFQTNPGVLKALSDHQVWAVLEDHEGFHWIGTEAGLFRFNLRAGQLYYYGFNQQDSRSLSDNRVRAIYEDAENTIWVGTENGLNRYQHDTNDFDRFSANDGPSGLSNNRVTRILQDNRGVLWIGTFDGLNAWQPATDEFESYHHDTANMFSLSQDTVQSIFQDAGNVLWIGTYKGLNSWNTAAGDMLRYKTGISPGLGDDMITSFAEDLSGAIWVGTFGAGLHHFDPNTHQFTARSLVDRGYPVPVDDRIMAVTVDRFDSLWVGTRDGGVFNIDKRSGTRHYQHQADNSLSLSANGVTTILEDSYGTIWIGTYAGGLNRLDRSSGSFTRFQHDPGINSSLSSNRVLALYEDSERTLWIGTQDGGLNRYDRESGEFTGYHLGELQQRASRYVTVITEDTEGHLWIGTHGKGIFRWSKPDRLANNLQLKRFSEMDGLPSGTIFSAEWGAPDELWMSTNEGLARLNIRTGTVMSFNDIYGLEDNEYNLSASMKSSGGRLYFGGVNGFNAFQPADIKPNSHLPHTVITEIRKGTEVLAFEETLESGLIELSHRDYLVSFRFAGLDYTATEKNRYRYRLEGLDSTWQEVGTQRQAIYTNLVPGDYVFRVQSANNSGVWSERDAVLKLRVAPAPWRTWWAYSIYLTLLLALVSFIAAAQYRKIRHARQLVSVNQALEAEIEVRHARENDLLRERDRSRQYFQVAEVVMIELDHEHCIRLINRRGLTLLQYPESDILGRRLESFVATRHHARVREYVSDVEKHASTYDYAEFPLTARDGSEHEILWRGGSIAASDSTQGRMLISGMDVTDVRQLEKAFRAKEKMTVMGTLAGGIAHDFNNILTAVYGYSHLTLGIVRDNKEARENVNQIISATERAKSLISRLLTYVGGEEHDFEPTDVAAVVVEAGELLSGSFTGRVNFRIDVPQGLPAVVADGSQIHQIVMNLCTNAAKAVQEGHGTVTVEAATQTLTREDLPAESELSPGQYFVLIVSDDGVGMDEETLHRIFDPFFTTNHTGFGGESKGTGLGLSMVHSIVTRHGGFMNVTSEKGCGSVFTVYLPACDGALVEDSESSIPASTGSASVLLIDDEEIVADVGARILEELGYEVIVKYKPAEALAALQQGLISVDVIITDETMPTMTGIELAHAIRDHGNKTPIILVSGQYHNLEGMERAWFLAKPYSIDDVQRVIATALDADRSVESKVVNFPRESQNE